MFLKISSSMSNITERTFYGCTHLSDLFLPKKITYLSYEAFSFCRDLKTIKSANPLPPSIYYNTFEQVNKTTCQLIVPFGSKKAYQTALYWREFLNITEQDLPDSLEIEGGECCEIYGANGQIVIESSVSNTKVEIFAVTGVPIKTIYTNGGKSNVSLPQGVYIVRVGGFFQKIIL